MVFPGIPTLSAGYQMSCSDKNGTFLSSKFSYIPQLLKWADSSACNGRNGDICLNIPSVQANANPGITIRCVKRSKEKLFLRFEDLSDYYHMMDYTGYSPLTSGLYHNLEFSYQRENTMSCETKDGKVLSTGSGRTPQLIEWAGSPACSDGRDRTCQYLPNILKPCDNDVVTNRPCSTGPYSVVHKEVEIECIEDHGRKDLFSLEGGLKYTLACKHNGVVLSTSKDGLKRLQRWARGPLCQPTLSFSTTQSTPRLTSTAISSKTCPELQAIQAETKNEAATLKCIQDKGNKYKLGCYINNELVSTITDTIENLKKWASGTSGCKVTCYCQEQFAAFEKAKCISENKWQCQKTILTGSCSGHITQMFQRVSTIKKKKRPEFITRRCEKLVQRTKCDPVGYTPNCGN